MRVRVRVCPRVSACVRVCPYVFVCVRVCPNVFACVRHDKFTDTVSLQTYFVYKAKPSQAKPSQAKPSQAKPSQAKPSQAKQSKAKQSKAKQSKAKQSKAKQNSKFTDTLCLQNKNKTKHTKTTVSLQNVMFIKKNRTKLKKQNNILSFNMAKMKKTDKTEITTKNKSEEKYPNKTEKK